MMQGLSAQAKRVAEEAKTIHLSTDANCAEAVWQAVARARGIGREQLVLGNKLACGFGGGLGVASLCGAAAGAIMGLGLFCGSSPGDSRDDEFRAGCRRYAERFEAEFGALDCRDLKREDDKAWCTHLVAVAAGLLWDQLESEGALDSDQP